MLHITWAGVCSTLPPLSIARTNRCSPPTGMSIVGRVTGDVHGYQGWSQAWHSKVAGSSAVKAITASSGQCTTRNGIPGERCSNFGVAGRPTPGYWVIVVWGGVESAALAAAGASASAAQTAASVLQMFKASPTS